MWSFSNLFSVSRRSLHSVDSDIGNRKKERPLRRIYINTPRSVADQNCHFPNNQVRTTKYTWLTFLPKNLFEQFRNVANIYFTVLVVLQFIKILEITNPAFAALPLVCILAATAFKDGLEDFKRGVQDKRLNEEITVTLDGFENVNTHGVGSVGWGIWKHFRRKKRFHQVNLRLQRSLSHPDIPPPSSHSEIEISPKPTPSQQNLRTTRELKWVEKRWKDVQVGDFVVLRNNDAVPADILILSTSEPENICYVETKSLDGETNLKVRRGPSETSHIFSPEDCVSLQGLVESEHPTPNLYSYQGALKLLQNSESPRSPRSSFVPSSPPPYNSEDGDTDFLHKIPLNINSLLLRGVYLRNTDWVIGLVLYTGRDTKIQMNTGITPSKRTRIEKQVNPHVILQFFFVFALCLFCTIAHMIHISSPWYQSAPWNADAYGSYVLSNAIIGTVTFSACIIIFQTLVPISLFVAVEVVKTMQAYFIHCDLEMYNQDLDKPCSVKSWNLSDDLGQIDYIFSDKTGTLTRNVMEFRKCSIFGKIYGDQYFKLDDSSQLTMEDEMRSLLREIYSKRNGKDDINRVDEFSDLTLVDPTLLHDIQTEDELSRQIEHFFIHMALCHTVIPERRTVESPDGTQVVTEYKSQSPDEAALVSGAHSLGFEFVKRGSKEVVICVFGKERKYRILEILEFNSTRKRMSVIVEEIVVEGDDESIESDQLLENGRPRKVLLLTKGADNIICSRLKKGQEDIKDTTMEHLQYFANDGLRTLCIASREIEMSEFMEWHRRYKTATTLPVNRDEEMEKLATVLETELNLLGATAIEDKLQDQVPETIANLLEAGIKIWVLTGDKLETAITVGFSCNLLQQNMTLLIVQGSDPDSVKQQLEDSWETITGKEAADTANQPAFSQPSGRFSRLKSWFLQKSKCPAKEPSKFALVIEGDSLRHALSSDQKDLFLRLGTKCSSVICCRVSPLQKAKVVSLVRKSLNCLSLAIGDGANDVSMIQEANIGVGIAGLEGYQAVMASDYAIGEFKFLARLLLVHGRWSYRRVSEMILTFFYKNVVWVFALFWYQFYCGFSSSILFEYSYVNYYNLFFTVIPNLFLGIFDQDLPAQYSFRYPQLYQVGPSQKLYNTRRFFLYLLDAFYQSIICFFFGYFIYVDSNSSDINTSDLYEVGTAIATYVIVLVNVFMVLKNRNWSWLVMICFAFNFSLFFLYIWAYSLYSVNSPIYGLNVALLQNPLFWLSLPIATAIGIAPSLLARYWKKWVKPSDIEIVRERYKLGLDEEIFRPASPITKDDASSVKNPKRKWWSLKFIRKIRKKKSDQVELQLLAPKVIVTPPSPDSQSQVPQYQEKEKTQSAFSVVLKPLQTLANGMEKTKDRFKNLVSMPSVPTPIKERLERSPSFLLYMNRPKGSSAGVPNTGFAFSSEEGIRDIVLNRPYPFPRADGASDTNIEISMRRSAVAATLEEDGNVDGRGKVVDRGIKGLKKRRLTKGEHGSDETGEMLETVDESSESRALIAGEGSENDVSGKKRLDYQKHNRLKSI
ncbi:hypothetical protein BKA69DRAFT_1063329 [Paraphysoderma sedebokerense]|nr:hypothetical protein BKA69DRAFT_1063329 [Paraphysoderma sedebokerense]